MYSFFPLRLTAYFPNQNASYKLKFVLCLQSLLLICKEPLVPLYEKGGFRVVGPSDVVHGADPWIEMDLKLHDELA